jgi:hypothetical protein
MLDSSFVAHDRPAAVIPAAKAALAFPALAVTLAGVDGAPRLGRRRVRRATVGIVGLLPLGVTQLLSGVPRLAEPASGLGN